jgi:5'-deoxynucleotidase YfbR-like HD superfamily hydrolase
MQQIDPEDPRDKYVQVAGAIRAAILSGELEPGEKLPTGEELAKFFGVGRVTVVTAIKELARDGYVTSGSGQRTQVIGLPAPAGGPLAGAADYLYEIGMLKNLPRAGWKRIGMPLPESVAEHSFRVGMIGMLLAVLDGADVGHTAALALMHDTPETRTGDITAVERAHVTPEDAGAVARQQTAALPAEAAKTFQSLVAEYEAKTTLEARLARDADKLESLIQALEYREQGYKTEAWVKTSLDALRTDPGKRLAQAIMSADPHHWWAGHAASYAEVRRDAKERA